MNRELTRRETVLLLILVVLVIFLGYFKLIFEPIQDQVAQYQDTTSQEQSELEQDLILLTRKQEMQRKIEEVRASGEERTIPQYDNSRRLMLDLHRILDSAVDYSLDFSQSTTQDSYIVLRPVTMSFQTHTYAQARAIVDALSESENMNQISEMFAVMEEQPIVQSVELNVASTEENRAASVLSFSVRIYLQPETEVAE